MLDKYSPTGSALAMTLLLQTKSVPESESVVQVEILPHGKKALRVLIQ